MIMALKPGTVKALFGKLATNADDIVRYGDDILDGTKPYLDDVYEDTTRLLNYYNSKTNWGRGAVPIKQVNSPVLQNALGAEALVDPDGYYLADIPNSGVLKKATDYLLEGNNSLPVGKERSNVVNGLFNAINAAPTSRNLNTSINFLGHNDIDQVGFNPSPYFETVKIPETPINSLVREIDYDEGTDFIRPHNNTALGRWFRQQMSKKV